MIHAIWASIGFTVFAFQVWYCRGIRNYVNSAAGDKFINGQYVTCRKGYNYTNIPDGNVPHAAYPLILILQVLGAGFFGPIQMLAFLGLPDRK